MNRRMDSTSTSSERTSESLNALLDGFVEDQRPPVPNVYVARQPIYNRSLDVVAYELLFRSDGIREQMDHLDGDQATAQVVLNTFVEMGLNRVVGSKRAFINFTRDWLNNYYRAVIDQAVDEVLPKPLPVEFVVDPERTANLIPGHDPTRRDLPSLTPSPRRPGPSHALSPAPGTHNGLLLSSDVVLNPSYRFNSYVVGPCNRFGWLPLDLLLHQSRCHFLAITRNK